MRLIVFRYCVKVKLEVRSLRVISHPVGAKTVKIRTNCWELFQERHDFKWCYSADTIRHLYPWSQRGDHMARTQHRSLANDVSGDEVCGAVYGDSWRLRSDILCWSKAVVHQDTSAWRQQQSPLKLQPNYELTNQHAMTASSCCSKLENCFRSHEEQVGRRLWKPGYDY